jgi:hypothetical protein
VNGNPKDDPELTEAQRLLTAFVDGEITASDRQRFDALLTQDPDLAAQVAEHQQLGNLSRSLQLMQPSDVEVRRFWAKFYNRGEWRLGWCLLIGGSFLLLGYALYELMLSQLSWVPKAGTTAVLIGGGILLWNSVRLKLRTSRFDRYRGVMY